eukprot:Sspe_Gene.63904::Locus_37137_Transcript_1_1_Confidence_1.000_Length_618::g.63904::m.63904
MDPALAGSHCLTPLSPRLAGGGVWEAGVPPLQQAVGCVEVKTAASASPPNSERTLSLALKKVPSLLQPSLLQRQPQGGAERDTCPGEEGVVVVWVCVGKSP